MTAHANLVAGKWVSSPEANRNLNPSNLDDLIGEYARADAAQAREAIAAAAAAAPGWARGNLQERADLLDRIGSTILERRTELGTLLSREEGKTLPEGIGEAARAGYIFKFFAGEVVRLTGEKIAVRAAGRRRRDHARAHRRGGHHHAVELPAGHPGLEDRAGAGLRQLRGVQAGRSGARLRLGPGGDHQPGRRAGWRVQSRHGSRRGGRRGDHHLTRGGGRELHRLGRDRARGGPPGRASAWPRCSSRWAARIRWSSSTTPTWRWR